MATIESDSEQSAKLSLAGSTPAVASFHTCYFVCSMKQMEEFMDLFPCWFIEQERASGETGDASALKADDQKS